MTRPNAFAVIRPMTRGTFCQRGAAIALATEAAVVTIDVAAEPADGAADAASIIGSPDAAAAVTGAG
jgi:hypothetical protein